MLKITYDINKLRLEFKGHAEGAETVCAAASMLLCALHATLVDSEDMLKPDSFQFRLKEGDSFIECEPKDEYSDLIHRSYYTIVEGLESMSRQFPQYVTFDILF